MKSGDLVILYFEDEYGCVRGRVPSSRRRVDGVEDDDVIQHGAENFDFHTGPWTISICGTFEGKFGDLTIGISWAKSSGPRSSRGRIRSGGEASSRRKRAGCMPCARRPNSGPRCLPSPDADRPDERPGRHLLPAVVVGRENSDRGRYWKWSHDDGHGEVCDAAR